MTIEESLAAIGLGILLWGGIPFAFWFYLGMGNRTDKAKKIYASIVLVLGIGCLMIAISCLIHNSRADNNLAYSYAMIGLLCFWQRSHIYSRIEKNYIERLTKQIKYLQDTLIELNKSNDTLNSSAKEDDIE